MCVENNVVCKMYSLIFHLIRRGVTVMRGSILNCNTLAMLAQHTNGSLRNTAEALVSIPDPRQDQCTEGLGTKPLRALLTKALLQHTNNKIVPL